MITGWPLPCAQPLTSADPQSPAAVLGLGILAFIVSIAVFGAFASWSNKQLEKMEAAPTAPGQPPADTGQAKTANEVVRLSFGEQHTWSGGETITVSAPEEYTSPNQFLQAPAGKRYVSFDITIRNDSQDEYNVMSTQLTLQHNGRAAQQAVVAGNPIPNVQIPPGGTTTYSVVYKVSDEPGTLQMSVQPNAMAQDTVYFTGKF